MTKSVKIAIFISGRGSNMACLIEACNQPGFPARPVIVISNNPAAAGLETARQAGIETATVIKKDYPSRQDYDCALDAQLHAHGVELICLAGFMEILSKEFVNRWHNQIINIHPSLLPAFKGLDTHERAIMRGVRFSGCTVHYVRFEMDTGPIIAQAVVSVLPRETPASLASRVLEAEHRIYPLALKLVTSGEVRVEGEHLIQKPGATCGEIYPALFSPPLSG